MPYNALFDCGSFTSNFLGTAVSKILYKKETSLFLQNGLNNARPKKLASITPRCSRSSDSNDSKDQNKACTQWISFSVLCV